MFSARTVLWWIKSAFAIVFIALSVHLWLFVPIVRAVLYASIGGRRAESFVLSFALMTRVHVLVGRDDVTGGFIDHVLYFGGILSEAFLFLAAMWLAGVVVRRAIDGRVKHTILPSIVIIGLAF